MAVLLQTLRPAAGIVFALDVVTPTCLDTQGTVATLADGSDSTGSALSASDDVDTGVGGAEGAYQEEWTLDTAAAMGNYLFLRTVARTAFAGAPPGNVHGTYQPTIDGVPRGAAHSLAGLVDDVQDFTTDPADGQPWTAAKVNAKRFGWRLTAAAAGPPLTLDATCTCGVADYKVELWGPDPVAVAQVPQRSLRPYTDERIAYMRRFAGFGP